MAEPAKMTLSQHGEHTGNSSPCQNVVVRHSVHPGDAHNLGVLCEDPVVPHPFRQLGHGCCDFRYPPVDLCLKQLAGRDGGPKLSKVLYQY